MKYVFIVEKSVFGDAMDSKSENNKSATKFLNILANQRSLKGYSIAIIPKSLQGELKTKTFFKNKKTYELVAAFIAVEESVSSDILLEDYFELARVKAVNTQPLIVSDKSEDFSGAHSTPVITTEVAMNLVLAENVVTGLRF